MKSQICNGLPRLTPLVHEDLMIPSRIWNAIPRLLLNIIYWWFNYIYHNLWFLYFRYPTLLLDGQESVVLIGKLENNVYFLPLLAIQVHSDFKYYYPFKLINLSGWHLQWWAKPCFPTKQH